MVTKDYDLTKFLGWTFFVILFFSLNEEYGYTFYSTFLYPPYLIIEKREE